MNSTAARRAWPHLKWWDSGERQVVEERIDDEVRARGVGSVNPSRNSLYRALQLVPPGEVKAVIIGQDPYPTHAHATGVAFSIPESIPPRDYPQTLRIIFDEYASDLGYAIPNHGNLERWSERGVLLWNAIPSVSAGVSLSHDWDEWSYLTREIIHTCNAHGVAFALLGSVARRYEGDVDLSHNRLIVTSHPSPRGMKARHNPFKGSRLFSTINAKLRELEWEGIDWELKDVPACEGIVQGTQLGGGRVLPNITGAHLGGLKAKGAPAPNRYEAPPWE